MPASMAKSSTPKTAKTKSNQRLPDAQQSSQQSPHKQALLKAFNAERVVLAPVLKLIVHLEPENTNEPDAVGLRWQVSAQPP